MSSSNGRRLCPMVLGASVGFIWGISLLILALVSKFVVVGYGHKLIELLASVYYGYGATVGGAFVGFAWGFGDMFIGGFVFALIFNALSRCQGCVHQKK